MWLTHTMEYYSITKKNEIMPFAVTWMDLEIIILTEVSQTEKDISYDTAYMWNLKQWYRWTYLKNRNRVTDAEEHQRGYQRGKKVSDKTGRFRFMYIHYYI